MHIKLLGAILVIGGLMAGVMLVSQPQLLNPKAVRTDYQLSCSQIECVRDGTYKGNSYCEGRKYCAVYYHHIRCPSGYEHCAGDDPRAYKDCSGTSASCTDGIRCDGVADCPSSDWVCANPGSAESRCDLL